MKRFPFILCIITFAFLISSCKAVNISPADELVSGRWQAQNPSGITASLSFDVPENTAELSVIDENGEEVNISGVFAADKEYLYITSTSLCKTYTFGYKAYKDRVTLTYNDVELTLYAAKEKEP